MGRNLGGWNLRTAVGALILGACVGFACSGDATEPEPRPTEDDLEELFTTLCTKRRDCQQSWGPENTVEECTRINVAAYVDKPTGCLHPVVDYYECAVSLDCSTFNLYPNTPCYDLLDTAKGACPPGTRF